MLLNACAVPQAIWPQGDLRVSDSPGTPGSPVVLLASRDSAFKQELVSNLRHALMREAIAYRIMGVSDLDTIDAADYDAVVVISTCLAWGLDWDVQTFIDRQKDPTNIVMVITSGDGDWQPARLAEGIDAISSASTPTSVDALAQSVMRQIRFRLQ